MGRYDIHKKPQSLDELEPMILLALEEVSELCHGKRFRMCIPVDDADSDIVIGAALRSSLAFVRAALGKPVDSAARKDAYDSDAEFRGEQVPRS